MEQASLAGEEYAGGRTVVVGIKLDSKSKELLTWALVKVAQTGDRVVALHVLSENETVDREGMSSLLCLVKAFDSVLAVYEGFCNLKQVDLKLKVCRGSSIRKILVRETKTYFASELVVGATAKHAIRCPSSMAKHCAKRLSKDCSVLAVYNGKIVFHRGCSSATIFSSKETKDHHQNGLLGAFWRSLHKPPKVFKLDYVMKPTITTVNPDLALLRSDTDCLEKLKRSCAICSPSTVPSNKSCGEMTDMHLGTGKEEISMAIMPVKKVEAASSSVSLQIRKKLPGFGVSWPLFRRAFSSNRHSSNGSLEKGISVVPCTVPLPNTNGLSPDKSDEEQIQSNHDRDYTDVLDVKSGAIVSVGCETVSSLSASSCRSKTLVEELEGLHDKYSGTCRLFKYQELLSATMNFAPENTIGKGGNSQVFKGRLSDGKEIAVKILKPSEDVLKEFVLEIEIVTALQHKNIMSLFGFCFENNNLLLVYDFLSRGSLEEILHGPKKERITFGWKERFKVAVGLAEALAYLHNEIAHPVIHRDVKSSNVLLSDDFEAQLSDFGLAKWASTTSSHITCSDVAGTFGYLAPEYFMYGKVNNKIDVYAFGVVLLELLSGRKPISNGHPKGQESLLLWAKPFLAGGKFSQVLDPHLGCDYDCDQMERMVLAAALCTRRAPRARPQISVVLKLLQGDAEVIKWARLEVNALEGSGQNIDALGGFDALNDEALSRENLKSYLNLALLDVDEESLSMSSIEQSISLEDYLRGRWSRSSSFD